jgi:hypothetical protein
MANIKISELNPLLTVEDADVLPIVDNAVTKKVTAAILRSYTQGNSVLLTGAQTVAGIKTFTSQLASSVATGTAPFSVASTTKVTNLNADLLDGLSSADFALSTRTLTAGTGLTGGGDLTANRTFAIDSTVATLTGTQTLTNKTITSPVINEILDSNGNEILSFTPIASATDYITIKNGIGVGVPLHISAAGSSANTGIHLEPKGTGLVQISDGTDTTKGIRFRSSASATGAVTLIDAVSSAGRVITLPNATTTLVGTNTTDTLTNKSIAGDTNTLSNIGNASLTNSAITINGTSTSLGGSINVGTVTSVAALTLGTSGTDVSSTVATGTTTPVITLNVPTASASNRGALSSTDWSTFNAKQAAITLTTTGTSGAATLVGSTLNIPNYADTDTGITSLNGLTALTQTFAVGTSGTDFAISSATSTHTFNLPTASATNRGALSSADWTTFNNKQNALTNPITGTGTTNYLPKFTGASALGNSTIFDNGNVGIGNSAPFYSLDLTGQTIRTARIYSASTDTRIYLQNTTSGAPTTDAGLMTGLIVNDAYFFNYQAGNSIFGTNGTERMRITSAGNVGFGTATPLSAAGYTTLSINNTTGSQITWNTGDVLKASIYNTTSAFNIYSETGIPIRIEAGGSEKMRIAANGNVLIGTTTDAGYKLDVNGTARVQGSLTAGSSIFNAAAGANIRLQYSGTDDWAFGTDAGAASRDFNFYNYNTSSINFGISRATGAATFSSSVTANGSVYIANANANNELTFVGTEFTNIFSETTSGIQFGITSLGTSAAIDFLTNNVTRLKIKSTGVINIASIPTSPVGLSTGDIWSNAGILTIV